MSRDIFRRNLGRRPARLPAAAGGASIRPIAARAGRNRRGGRSRRQAAPIGRNRHDQPSRIFCAAGRRGRRGRSPQTSVEPIREQEDRVLRQRRAGACPPRRRRRRRRAAEAQRGDLAGQHPVRLAASLPAISLRGVEQRRPRAHSRRQAPGERVADRSRLRRLDAARRAAAAAVAPDPLLRRRQRRVSADRLQPSERGHRAPHQPRRHARRPGRADRQAGRRHLRPPGPHHARQPVGDLRRARQQRRRAASRRTRARSRCSASRTAC